MRTFIFACPQNTGRSQMASAFFNAFADADRAQALSASIRPRRRPQAKIVKVMREVGIDVATLKPQRWTRALTRGPAQVVTLGHQAIHPFLPGMGSIDWPVPDTRGLPIRQLRALRDDIRSRVLTLLEDESVGPPQRPPVVTSTDIPSPFVHHTFSDPVFEPSAAGFPQPLSSQQIAANL